MMSKAILFAATVAAILVATVQFALRAWQENDMNAKMRQVTIKIFHAINYTTGLIYQNLNHDVPVVEVSHKSPKVRRKVQ